MSSRGEYRPDEEPNREFQPVNPTGEPQLEEHRLYKPILSMIMESYFTYGHTRLDQDAVEAIAREHGLDYDLTANLEFWARTEAEEILEEFGLDLVELHVNEMEIS